LGTILVSGGAGYIGSVCSQQLLAQGHEVLVIDNLSTGHASAVPKGATLYELSYGDRPGLSSLLRRRTIDAVFHFAAKALIAESVLNPGIFFDANVASAITFLETLREFGVKRFVFSSSAAVYGNPARLPIHEEDPKNPLNSYGETKLMLERILDWYASAYGWTVVAFRYFNACGATAYAGEDHRPETHIIPLLLETASRQRSRFEIYGDDYETPDGTCIRDYVHVSDVAAAHLLALEVPFHPGFTAYNLGCGRGYSVKKVVQAVEEITGRDIPLTISSRRPGDPAILWASANKIRSRLNWKPLHSDLPTIIASAWRWHEQRAKRHAA
jgi:UDP-glucose 4-epimerase